SSLSTLPRQCLVFPSTTLFRSVSGRDLIDPGVARSVDDPPHGLVEISGGEPLLCLGARHPSPRAMRRGEQGGRVAPAADDVRAGPHRARDTAHAALGGVDGPLTREPHGRALDLDLLGVVVVTVHPLRLSGVVVAEEPAELTEEAVHHLVPVEPGETLRPPQLREVLPELRRPLAEVGVIGVREPHTRVPTLLPGDRDVLLGDLVTDAATPGVEEAPHRPRLVEAQLDEVVASAETAQLLTPPRRVRQVDAVGLGAVLQLAD